MPQQKQRCVKRIIERIEVLNWIPAEQAPKDGTQLAGGRVDQRARRRTAEIMNHGT